MAEYLWKVIEEANKVMVSAFPWHPVMTTRVFAHWEEPGTFLILSTHFEKEKMGNEGREGLNTYLLHIGTDEMSFCKWEQRGPSQGQMV